MFRRSFYTSLRLYRTNFITGENKFFGLYYLDQIRSYAFSITNKTKAHTQFGQRRTNWNCKCQVYRYYSRGILDGDTSDLQNAQKERELTHITSLYPSPRITLNEFATKSPNNVFDIHYKQSVVAPKAARKKTMQNDWTCTYSFVWPEKMKFEGTAISKRKAAEKAALLALHWLHTTKRIDSKGFPVHDRSVIETLNSSIQEPFRASISENSMERVDKVWNDYENEIKNIYDRTFNEAKQRVYSAPAVMKDSTLDEEDELLEDASPSNEDAFDSSDTKTPVHPVYCKHIPEPTKTGLDRRKVQLQRTLSFYDDNRTPLPIDDYRSVLKAFQEFINKDLGI